MPVDDTRLLQALLEAVPTHSDGRMRPVVLRSTEIHRQHVLGDWRPASWFDTLLLRAQQLMLVGAVLAAGYWFADGPLRDWLHMTYKTSATIALERPRVTTAAPIAVIQLPSTISAMSGPAPSEAFMMPRQTMTAVVRTATPVAVELMPNSSQDAQPPVAEAFMMPRPGLLLESQVSSPTPVPTQEILPTPAEPTHLLIPSIGLDTPVVKVFPVGDTWGVAEYAAGYLYGTARAGEAGNMAIGGHLGLHGAVFLNLSALQAGADIYVDAAGWRYHYRMRGSQVVWPNQVEVLYPEETTTLTLITCTNWDTQRLVVTGDLLGWEFIGAQ